MLLSSVSARQRMVTLRAWVEKNRAVWPAFDRQVPPRDAASEDDRPRPQDVIAVEVHLMGRGVDSRNRPRREDLPAEPARLLRRTTRKLVAGHTRREAEVVLDPRRRTGLAARRLPQLLRALDAEPSKGTNEARQER